MIQLLRHRGPDDCDVHVDDHLGLGHARLSILDIAGGHQPMPIADRSLWISFNGEIFNYVELRKDLEERGHQFANRSDTEVVLHLYQEKGEDCVRDMNGQWAFAIWDRPRKRLFLSRDRAGVRPLYYTSCDNSFIFGSEIKSLLACPSVSRQIDLLGLDQIFTFWSPIAPRTIFKNIQELPPGHSLRVEDGKIQVWKHWEADYSPGDVISEEEGVARLRDLLIDATRIRLRSDVPVGAYLSGGLDSTVITAIIRRHTSSPLKTFSVTFEDPEFDESRYQQEAIRFLETDHQEIRCGYDDIARVFPSVIHQTECPVLRTAPAPLFLLSSLVRQQGYKVVLTGEGSDEVLGGYDIYKEAKIRRFWGKRLDSKIRPLLLKRLYPYMPGIQSQSSSFLRAFFHVTKDDLSNPFFSHLPRWNLTARLKAFYSDEVKSALLTYDSLGEMRDNLRAEYLDWDAFSQAQYLETKYLLPGYILSSQGDRMAMAHSVEGRFPFLDYRVMEFAAGLPAHFKMRVLNEKYILKRAAADLIPTAISERPKQPYRAPDSKSFFGNGKARREYVEELFSPHAIDKTGLFNPRLVSKLVEKVKQEGTIGAKDNMAVVGILSTQLLAEQFIQGLGLR
jgi:asparagine synthase (glutamine-hydrolysing)